ncbi:MAG: DUF4167 domain-containing protein [Hyphomonadaceae bacterium]
MKRQRGRGRKPGGGGQHHHNHHQPNRSMESNGPEGGKVRGNASLIYERYLQLARDAASSGDRVLSENYLQHADHYFRLVRQMQPAQPVQPVVDRFASGQEFEGEDEGGLDAGEGSDDAEANGDRDEQPEADFSPNEAREERGDRGDRGEGEFRRGRRGRRGRFRPDGEGEREGGEPREERAEGGERQERRERRPPRDRGGDAAGEQAGPEGFSSGPKPAFLGSD